MKRSDLLLNISIALIYILAGKLGLSFAFDNPSASTIWAPSGIALAAILLFGTRVIPAIFFGAFFVNVTTAGTIITSLGIALGNTLEGTIAAYLVNKFANGIRAFDSVSDIFKFTFFAAFLSTMISADIGVTTLLVGHLAQWDHFWSIWTSWWLGDMGGILLITPLILVWKTHPRFSLGYKSALHFFLSLSSLFVVSVLVFYGILPYPYLCIPIAVWIAFWFGRKGASIATIMVAAISIYYTIHGQGPYANASSLNNSLILLQQFLCIFSVTSLTFATAVLGMRKGQKDLVEHEQRFKALIEKSAEGISLVDKDGKIIYTSSTTERLLGYTPEEYVKQDPFKLIYPADIPKVQTLSAELFKHPNSSISLQYRVKHKNGTYRWLDVIGTNLLEDPAVQAIVANFRDITEHKSIEEKIRAEKAEDEALLASIGEGIIATNNKGEITMVNKAACDMLGCKEKELKGKLMTEAVQLVDEQGKVLPIADRPVTKVLSLGKEIVTSQTYYYVKKDKTNFPVRFTITPIILDDVILGTIEVFHDITIEKDIDRMKDEFISMASHELRTPMTAVNGLLSMILNSDYGPVNEKLKRPLENIHISAQRQIHLINDLLDVSRLQTGKITFTITTFSLGQVIDEIVKLLQPIAQEKGLVLQSECKEDSPVQGDIEWSKHILNNLIGNALKFTNAGTISIACLQEKDTVLIKISDTGIGIDSSDYNKLFGKFQQLNSYKSNKPAGSGLGLYLSQKLARKMGGDVRLEKSKLKNGSTFIFSLPKANTVLAKNTRTALINSKEIAKSEKTG